MSAPAPFAHHAEGRSLRTALVLALVWTALALALLLLQAAPWIIGLLALTTLPAALDLWHNRLSGLTLDQQTLSVYAGRHAADYPLSRIAKVRFDTRWDFSVRVTVIDQTGKKTRLPYEALPKPDRLDEALRARGVKTERHTFTIL